MKQIKENAKTKMEKSINVTLSDFAGIRAGRANPSVLNKVQVEYYGAMTPVTQMAAVSVAEADIGFSTISLEIPKRLVIISLLTAPTPELQMTRYSMIFSSSRILPGQL